MTGFAIVGALYDTTDVVHNVEAFRAMSLILMVSRLVLMAQYGVVLWYIRGYHSTRLPLLTTMAVLFIAAMIFLGTYWGYNTAVKLRSTGTATELKQPETFVAWYVVVVVEAAAVIAISSIWRVVSFKRTRLVERIGLLTLIMMGEGIIGMTKSVSLILQNSQITSGSDIGIIAAAVLLIVRYLKRYLSHGWLTNVQYFIWVLYFDQIEHDRFGTIRQQIWAILHFPLHIAILLTVQGSATLILWNIIRRYM